ncbi:mucin-5B-like isoform X2 [Eriocheir sinensis]|uniref:mucin-5B-like isoform X2 n=1 Tax=Eriocheir sinensis TaxID=95602 RepID=UPI0021C60623|nr:mucin-5B-like isoform X2 [Eriocheir sinensis]
MAFLVFVTLTALLHVTQGVLLDRHPTPFRHCCYGDETFQHGQVVLALQRACLQLVCEDGKVERRYLGEPGQRECCEFDGQLYPEGAELTAHCVTLECRDSCWHPLPAIADCCSRCSLYNDPHITTFDNHHYDFHGVCNYSLAQKGFTREAELGVYGDFRSCFGRASCIDRFTFVNDPHTVVALENGNVFTVHVNGHPNHVGPDKVHALRSAEKCHPVLAWRTPWGTSSPSCLTLFGSNRIMVQHCPHRMDIIAHASHTAELNGLCGHFNFHKDDDFTDRSDQVHPLSGFPLAFPTSWMTADQSDPVCLAPCRDCHKDNTTDPCTATIEERRGFHARCNATLFRLLRDLPHLAHHVDDCAFDLCVITAYGRQEEEAVAWLDRVLEIVKMEIFLHHHTDGKVTPSPTTAAPTSSYNAK